MESPEKDLQSVIHVRAGAELLKQGKELARKKGMSLSAFVRYLLITELEKAKAQ